MGLPKGFSDVSGDVSGWVKLTEGASVSGYVRGRFKRRVGDGNYFAIELTVDAMGADGNGSRTLKKGEVVGLDERTNLAVLSEHIGKEVYVEAVGKVATDAGREVWKYVVGAK